MTVLVGVQCSDGVVIGADSMATSVIGNGGLLQTETDKIRIVGGRAVIAGTGSVGLGQRFGDVVQTNWDAKTFQSKTWDCLRKITTDAVKDFQSTGVQNRGAPIGFGFGALLAVPIEDRPCLVEYSVSDMQPELKDGKIRFVAMGSGQMLAEPFVAFVHRVLWGEAAPNVQTALFGVYWALSHTIRIAPGGVGWPIKLATLRRVKGIWKAELVDDGILQEQAQYISEIEGRIGEYPRGLFDLAEVSLPPTPPK